MTAVLDRPRAAEEPVTPDLGRWVVPFAAVAVVILRLPFLGHPASPDEAGFLVVGSQWHSGGTSLYGNYWVDRPPLLIGIFQLASMLGGLPALRILGCLAAALTVLGSAKAAGSIAGRRAAGWTAVVAAALLATPTLGTIAVNGELLASPFLAWSIAATVAALRAAGARRGGLLAIGAGASAMAAVLIKQNLADAFVFGLVTVALAWHWGEITRRRGARILLGAIGGVVVTAGVVALMTSLHGTSLRGVFEATYPFRIEAGRVMAAGGRQHAVPRLLGLLVAGAISGLAILMVASAWGAATRRLRGAVSWGLIAAIVFAAASVAIGANYWRHYLIELVVPIAIVIGVLVARNQPHLRPIVVTVAVVSAASWAIWLGFSGSPIGEPLGRTIAASAAPTDTIVVAYGHADVVESSGLSSPYRYLWSLPVKTLDPRLQELDRVLSGPHAPTWFVTWNRVRSWGLDSATVQAVVRRDYRPVDRICGHTVYLRKGATRPELRAPTVCPASTSTDKLTKDNLP
ncbi:MAG: hypothetical protein ACXWDC_03970 [Aeromicrobium sp.]